MVLADLKSWADSKTAIMIFGPVFAPTSMEFMTIQGRTQGEACPAEQVFEEYMRSDEITGIACEKPLDVKLHNGLDMLNYSRINQCG